MNHTLVQRIGGDIQYSVVEQSRPAQYAALKQAGQEYVALFWLQISRKQPHAASHHCVALE